jgi:Ca2+-binding EF-hand superfamily protein
MRSIVFILMLLIFSVSYSQKLEQGIIYEDLYLKNTEIARQTYDYAKRYYLTEKPKEKNALHDSLVRWLDNLKFTCAVLSNEPKLNKELVTIHKECIKKIEKTETKAVEIKKMVSGDSKNVQMEKLIFSTGELVTDIYFAYLLYTQEPINRKSKAPKNALKIDSLEILKTDKNMLFNVMKEHIKYNTVLSINIRETEKMLKAGGLTPEEKSLANEELDFMRKEKYRNDRILYLIVEKLNEVRGKIIETAIAKNNLKEEFKLFDKDGDGIINVEEVYTAIDEYLDGKISLSPQIIYSLIDFYFDAELY